MAALIAQYGYLAILIGCFMEGETVLVVGAIAAKLGYLDIGLVILCGMIGTFLGDNLFFFLGRWYGDKLIRKWPVWRLRARGIKKLLKKYDTWFILGFRFVYGVRSISPFVIGMSGVRPQRFMVLDLIACAAWSAAIGGASFALGSAVELFITRIKGYEAYFLGTLAVAALFGWLAYLARMRMKAGDYLETGELPDELRPEKRRRKRRRRAKAISQS